MPTNRRPSWKATSIGLTRGDPSRRIVPSIPSTDFSRRAAIGSAMSGAVARSSAKVIMATIVTDDP